MLIDGTKKNPQIAMEADSYKESINISEPEADWLMNEILKQSQGSTGNRYEPEPVKEEVLPSESRYGLEDSKIDKSEPSSQASYCESCPSCGTWDHAGYKGKLICFHRAYFIGKAGKPVLCDIAKQNCPRQGT